MGLFEGRIDFFVSVVCELVDGDYVFGLLTFFEVDVFRDSVVSDTR